MVCVSVVGSCFNLYNYAYFHDWSIVFSIRLKGLPGYTACRCNLHVILLTKLIFFIIFCIFCMLIRFGWTVGISKMHYYMRD